jgi:hypothetical protein
MGACRIIVSQQRAGWHLSISREDRLPSWEEVRDARYALVPDAATMALLLPPRSEYVNVHAFCLQLYEIPSEYIEHHQDRLAPNPDLPRDRGKVAAVNGLTTVGEELEP